MGDDKMVLIQTLVPPELKREVVKLARQQNRPLSNFVRQILMDLIEKEKGGKTPPGED